MVSSEAGGSGEWQIPQGLQGVIKIQGGVHIGEMIKDLFEKHYSGYRLKVSKSVKRTVKLPEWCKEEITGP